jgi:hypothetical protein
MTIKSGIVISARKRADDDTRPLTPRTLIAAKISASHRNKPITLALGTVVTSKPVCNSVKREQVKQLERHYCHDNDALSFIQKVIKV